MSERVYWASIVLDTLIKDGTPWVLFVNARPTAGTGPMPVDGPLRVAQALSDEEARETAEEILRRLGWRRSTAWEERQRGWVCWLQSTDLDGALDAFLAADYRHLTIR